MVHCDAMSGPVEAVLATWGTVHAHVSSITRKLLGLIVLARLIRDAVLVDVSICPCRISARATSSAVAVDQSLRRQTNLRPLAVLFHGNSIGECGSHSMCPATC